MDQLTLGINRIGTDTEFNTIKLLDSSAQKYDGVNSEIKLQVGANSGQIIGIQLKDMRANSLNISGASGVSIASRDGSVIGIFSNTKCDGSSDYALDVSTPENANAAIKIYDDAIIQVSSSRAALGATQNVLEYRIDYLDNTAENLTAAESRIRDADIAKEIMEYEKRNLLCQVCQAMLAQANHQSDSVLELLKSL